MTFVAKCVKMLNILTWRAKNVADSFNTAALMAAAYFPDSYASLRGRNAGQALRENR